MVDTVNKICQTGKPKHIHIIAVIATPAGIGHVGESVDLPVDIWCGAIDEELNDQAYIVPGLGDAGDLAFGPKL